MPIKNHSATETNKAQKIEKLSLAELSAVSMVFLKLRALFPKESNPYKESKSSSVLGLNTFQGNICKRHGNITYHLIITRSIHHGTGTSSCIDCQSGELVSEATC